MNPSLCCPALWQRPRWWALPERLADLLGRLAILAASLRPLPSRPADDARSADETARYLLDTYGNAILRLAYSYLHNMSDAEEILQDTLLKYLQTQPVLEGPAHEKTWLMRVAANLSKNRIDYNRLRQTDELNETLAEEERGDLSFVWEAVKSLPQQYREVIHLFYYEGYSTKEIARVLSRREATVRSDLHRGRERLKAILKEAYDFA